MQEINTQPRTPTEMLSPEQLPGLGCYQQGPNKEEQRWVTHCTWVLVSTAAQTPAQQEDTAQPGVAELTKMGSDSLSSQRKHNLGHGDSPG